MTEPVASSRSPEAARLDNQIGPDRARRGEAKTRSTSKGDLPQAILDRYLIERDLRGRPERFYRDHRTSEPAFHDQGRRLGTDRAYPDTVADMLKVAQHRGWTRLKVEGDDAFRREVWIQGRAMGLDIKGYSPRDRDRQAAGQPASRRPLEERLRMASVVVRNLIPNPEAQRRLLNHAAAAIARITDRGSPERRSRTRDRQR
ncbi:MAG: hypothetical protein IE912_02635 [Brevundimonas diminuta]|nr:LPD7 domain-containing protein [Brevundimonas diminuta]MBD3817799.1 hypothetical protein [Brevundimonas diminuta]